MDIHIDGVRFTRTGREVLGIPTLQIRQRRVTAILGANGAGKTTLLRLIAGLECPDEGRVLVGGDIADTRRRIVGYVFQEEVFLRRPLIDNLVTGLLMRALPRPVARERALRALRLLGIERLAGRRADRMSGGEARRASLARALCLGAPVLLLDEPLAGLDGVTYSRLLDELPGVLSASGATTVLVTHDREEALRLCDDIVVLVRGMVAAAGEKAEIATNPGRADVAEALGYAILAVGGRQVAVPEGELRLGPGAREFAGRVEAVFDLVREWDIVVAVGDARVHVRVPRSATGPSPGEHVVLNAGAMYEVV